MDSSILWVNRNHSDSSFHSTHSQPPPKPTSTSPPSTPSTSITSSSSSSSSPSSSSSSSSSSSIFLPSTTTPPPPITPPTTITTKNLNRTRAIQELIQTEHVYASDLIIIRDIYLYRASGPPPSQAILSPIERQTIFSNINQLTQLAIHLSQSLTKANSTNQIGNQFIQFLPTIEKLYTVYCSKYALANKTLEEFTTKIERKQKKLNNKSNHHNNNYHQHQHQRRKTREELPGIKYFNECKKLCQGRTSAWDLGSLLIKPVQRCLKYSLLLDQIIKYTQADDLDLNSLIKARDGMINVADTINETKRRHEVVGEMISRSAPLSTRYAVRLGARISGTGGWPSPPVLLGLITQIKRSVKALDALPIDLIESQNSIVLWIGAADRLVDAFKDVFSLRSNSLAPHPAGILLADLEAYQHLVLKGTLNGPLNFLRKRIRKEIIPRIEQLKELYTKPIMLIDKYEKRSQTVVPTNIPPSNLTTIPTTTNDQSSSISSSSDPSSGPSSSSLSTAGSEETHQLIQIERFLLDQLPPFIHLANLSLNRILLNLFYSIKLYHSDLIILIKKVLKIS